MSKVYPENREFHQIFPDVIEPGFTFARSAGVPAGVYTGAARYDTIEIN